MDRIPVVAHATATAFLCAAAALLWTQPVVWQSLVGGALAGAVACTLLARTARRRHQRDAAYRGPRVVGAPRRSLRSLLPF
jgi:hypothetical protein